MNIKNRLLQALGVTALIFFVGASLKEDVHFWDVYFTGNHAVGTPISVHTRHAGRYNQYTGTVQFIPDNGVPVMGSRRLTSDLETAFTARRPVSLRYNARNPGDFVLEGERAVWPVVLWGVVISLFLLGCLAIIALNWTIARPIVAGVKPKPRARKVKRHTRRDKRYRQ